MFILCPQRPELGPLGSGPVGRMLEPKLPPKFLPHSQGALFPEPVVSVNTFHFPSCENRKKQKSEKAW